MECCQCEGIEIKFDQKYVTKKLAKYRKKGPKNTTLQLIAALQAEGIQEMALIDIGGGIGDIQHALLKSGVSQATNAEASSAYIEACKQEAEQLGHSARIDHHQGDFVELAAGIPAADIVTLDRVICCYHDMHQLVSLSAQKARRLYGVVYPRDTWWTRLGTDGYYNLRNWLQRNPMRMFVHPTEEVEAVLRENGFERCFYREMGSWQVVVFSRA
jgi:magnesium-protoporphyrin O-methyltransferase